MEFPNGDTRQIPHQGALLCQDWPGPEEWVGKPIPQDFYFAGDDLDSQSNLLGLIGFFFACYGGGTPEYDEFSRQAFKERQAIAPHPFIANLPSKMLSHPKGGALAVIGHIERTWGYSFLWKQADSQTSVFENSIERLLKGYPIGFAIERFNERYGELATELSNLIEQADFGAPVAPTEISGMWTAHNDARDYIIIGDPAVCLSVVEADESPVELSAIEVTTQSANQLKKINLDELLNPLEGRVSEDDWEKTPTEVQKILAAYVEKYGTL
jgi:hypothetical protein